MKTRQTTRKVHGKKEAVLIMTEKGRTSKVKPIPGIPTSAYVARFKAKSRKSPLSFIKRKTEILQSKGDKTKIILVQNGKVERYSAPPLLLNEARKAIRDYKAGKIKRREIDEATQARAKGRQSKEFKALARRAERREKLSAILPFRKEGIVLTIAGPADLNKTYHKLAETLPVKDVEELILANKSKIDRGLFYKITPLNRQGEALAEITLRNISPDAVATWLTSLKNVADKRELPPESPPDGWKEAVMRLYPGIKKSSTLKIELVKSAPGSMNGNLHGYRIGVSFARWW